MGQTSATLTRLQMPAQLRNEDYIAFLDESDQDRLQIVSGVLIPARWLRPAERRWKDFIRDHVGSRSGRVELKSRNLLKGKGGAALHAQALMLQSGGAALSIKSAGWQLYRDALQHIARTTELRVVSVALPGKRALPAYRLWHAMAYAALIQRPHAPRPRLPLTVIDGEDAAFRGAHDLMAYRFYRRFAGRQPYIASGREWFVGGSVHQDSALHPFVQMADLVAGAARVALIGTQQPQSTWYQSYLQDQSRKLGRDVDVSAFALDCLKALDPKDLCGTKWAQARVV